MSPPAPDYASRPDQRPLRIARSAELSAFAGFAALFFTFFGVPAIAWEWLAWATAVLIVATVIATPCWLAAIAVRRARSLPRADLAAQVLRSAARARRSALVLFILGALILYAFPSQLTSWRETRDTAERARHLP
jgi:hypothetical protein